MKTKRPMVISLYYGDISIGDITDSFCSDGTWYGVMIPTISPGDGHIQERLLSFIEFSEEWNERTKRNEAASPDEFERYGDMLRSGLWLVKTRDGASERIETAPVFFRNGEISWQVEGQGK